MRRTARILAMLALPLLAIRPTAASAEPSDRHVRGVVTDGAGTAVPGVTVVATLAGLPISTTVTNDAGAYEFTGLPVSTMVLTFRAGGFSPAAARVNVAGDSWVAQQLTTSPRVEARRLRRDSSRTTIAASVTHADR
jgi:hypothetical protein